MARVKDPRETETPWAWVSGGEGIQTAKTKSDLALGEVRGLELRRGRHTERERERDARQKPGVQRATSMAAAMPQLVCIMSAKQF